MLEPFRPIPLTRELPRSRAYALRNIASVEFHKRRAAVRAYMATDPGDLTTRDDSE